MIKPPVERRHPPTWLMKIVNPVMRRVLRRPGPATERLLILHVPGRRTGRVFDVPAGYREVDGRLEVISDSRWRLNLRSPRPVPCEVTVRGVRKPAHVQLIEDPEHVLQTYLRVYQEVGQDRAPRELGIRVNVDRKPTPGELSDAIRASGLNVVLIELH